MKRFFLALIFPLFLFTSLVFAPGAFAQGKSGNIEDMPLDDPSVPTLPTAVPTSRTQGAPQTPAATASATTDSGTATDNSADATASNATNDFMKQARYAGIVVAVLCSYLGLFVVGRRMVFIGVALSEMSSAGIALGLLLGFSPLVGALLFMVLGVALFSRRWAPRLLPNDAVIGAFYVMAIALGILLVAKSAQGETHMLTLLQGDVLTVYPSETLQMALIFLGIGAVHLIFSKEFLLVSLDRDMASTLGYPAALWDFLLFLTIGIAVSLSIRSVGVLMTTAMLIIPASTALLVCPRWNRAAILAPVLGIIAVCIGLQLSLNGDFPASAVIVAILFVFMLPALLWHSLRRA